MIEYIKAEYIDDIKNYIQEKQGKILKINILDEEEIGENKILEELENLNIFEGIRVFILKNPKNIIPKLKNIKTEDLIYVYLPTKSKLKATQLKQENIAKYINALFSKKNVKITINTINQIIGIVGENRMTLKHEIHKCINFIYPKKEITNIKEIKGILSYETQSLIWNLTDAIVAKKKSKAMTEYLKLKETGEDPRGISSIMAWQIKIMLLIKIQIEKGYSSTEIKNNIFKATGSKISDFTISKVKNTINAYSQEKLKIIFHKIINLNTATNRGEIDIEISLPMLITSI
jgi:DNA polymerase III delta subunit